MEQPIPSSEQPSELLERARATYQVRAWPDACELFARADGIAPLELGDLELFAWSSRLSGHDEKFLKLLERLHHAYLDNDNCCRAARMAFFLGMHLFTLGEPAKANGWHARAERLLEREGKECVERGYLLIPVSLRHAFAGDYAAASRAAEEAAQIGDGFREADLSAIARNVQARALIGQGQTQRGLSLLDEVMVSASSGELSPFMVGLIYCGAIAGCQQVYAFGRAREWSNALAEWCAEQPGLVSFTGTCRVHRAELMQVGGQWLEAIEEARRATEGCSKATEREVTAEAFYQQAEIERLRGEFTAAEDAYRSAGQFGRDPQPGLSLLRLAQGRSDAAVSSIRRALAETRNKLLRTRLLPAYVEIMLASDELDDARTACAELEALAALFQVDVLSAIAEHARGAVLLAEGNAQAALEPLRRAFETWQQVGAPYIAARLRLMLARACHALGDVDGSQLQLDLARETFATLGAAPDVVTIDAMSTTATVTQPTHGLTARELQVLRLVAAGKTNKMIATELALSEKTIDRHVSNMFTKLNVPSRAAATAYAYENKLI